MSLGPVELKKRNRLWRFRYVLPVVLILLGLALVRLSRVAGTPPTIGGDGILWPDTVKQGTMFVQVHGLGTIVRAERSKALLARVGILGLEIARVGKGQKCEIDTRRGFVAGSVQWIASEQVNGVQDVDVRLDGPLPSGVGVGTDVDGTITVGRLENIVYMGRPVHGERWSEVSLFKYTESGDDAIRVKVKLGEASVNEIQVVSGLKPGDRVILSDMSQWDGVDRIQVK